MSSDAILDTFIVLDALSHGLNMSIFELTSILSAQAPLSNLLLLPLYNLQPSLNSTLTPAQLRHKIRQVPTFTGTPIAATMYESENDLYREFVILYWCCLTFVISVAVLAMCTKMKMAVNSNLERMERNTDRTKPLTDIERWCMRRKTAREVEARKREAELQRKEVDRVGMEHGRE